MKVVHYIGTFDVFFWGGGHPKKTGMSNNRKCTRLCNLYQVIKSPNSNAQKGVLPQYYKSGISILTSKQEKPPVKKLPIFSEFIENSAKFIKISGLTKWTQNLRQEDQNQLQGPGVHCLKIEATHQSNVFISVFCWIGDHIWQKHCLYFINT